MICHLVPDGRHRYRLRVYYEDTDAGGVVYHANYLRFAERARTEALRDLGVPHAEMVREHGVMFMVRRIKLDYSQPARLDDLLTVITHPHTVGAASLGLLQIVAREGMDSAVLVAMEVQLACVRMADGRPARIPARWRAALSALAPLSALVAGQEDAPIGAQ